MMVDSSRPSSSSSSIVSSSSSSTARASSTWNRDTRRFGPQNALDGTSDLSWNSGPSSASENNNEMSSSSDGRSSNNYDPSSSSSFAQYYEIHFHRSVKVHEIRVQFQGGFVGLDCTVYKQRRRRRRRDDDTNNDIGDDEWEEMEELYMDPMDTTDVQSFHPSDVNSLPSNPMVTAIRIEFGKSTDFYGRIVLYSIEVWGMEISEE